MPPGEDDLKVDPLRARVSTAPRGWGWGQGATKPAFHTESLFYFMVEEGTVANLGRKFGKHADLGQ